MTPMLKYWQVTRILGGRAFRGKERSGTHMPETPSALFFWRMSDKKTEERKMQSFQKTLCPTSAVGVKSRQQPCLVFITCAFCRGDSGMYSFQEHKALNGTVHVLSNSTLLMHFVTTWTAALLFYREVQAQSMEQKNSSRMLLDVWPG